MTSISGFTPNIQQGRQMMNARIASAVSSGQIDSTEQSAFGKALDSIDSTLSSSTGTTAKSGEDMKAKMDSLIDAQVDAGTLTSDQAKDLKSLFAQGGPGGSGGPGGPGGPGGMQGSAPMGPPPPPPTDASGSSNSSSSTTTDTTATTETTSSTDTMAALLDQLREALLADRGYGGRSYDTSGLFVNVAA